MVPLYCIALVREITRRPGMLAKRDVISSATDNDVAGQSADGHHGVGGAHPPALDVVDPLIDLRPGAVELGRMNVDHERPAGLGGYGDAGWKSDPVVGMDDVETLAGGQAACQTGVALDLGQQVTGIVTGAWHLVVDSLPTVAPGVGSGGRALGRVVGLQGGIDGEEADHGRLVGVRAAGLGAGWRSGRRRR